MIHLQGDRAWSKMRLGTVFLLHFLPIIAGERFGRRGRVFNASSEPVFGTDLWCRDCWQRWRIRMSYASQHDNGQFVAVSTKAQSEADRAKSTSEAAELCSGIGGRCSGCLRAVIRHESKAVVALRFQATPPRGENNNLLRNGAGATRLSVCISLAGGDGEGHRLPQAAAFSGPGGAGKNGRPPFRSRASAVGI